MEWFLALLRSWCASKPSKSEPYISGVYRGSLSSRQLRRCHRSLPRLTFKSTLLPRVCNDGSHVLLYQATRTDTFRMSQMSPRCLQDISEMPPRLCTTHVDVYRREERWREPVCPWMQAGWATGRHPLKANYTQSHATSLCFQ